MKMPILILLVVGLPLAEQKKGNYNYLYADSSVNMELHSIIFPIPDKYEFLRQQIISNEKLDSIAKKEIGKIEVYTLSGKIVKGRHPSVMKTAMSIGGTEISFMEIDHVSFTEKKHSAGF
jgi:hypothetical protein